MKIRRRLLISTLHLLYQQNWFTCVIYNGCEAPNLIFDMIMIQQANGTIFGDTKCIYIQHFCQPLVSYRFCSVGLNMFPVSVLYCVWIEGFA